MKIDFKNLSYHCSSVFALVVLVLFTFGEAKSSALNSEQAKETNQPALNLDSSTVVDQIVSEMPKATTPTETLKAEPNKLQEQISKAAKHGLAPTFEEISVPGAPQRVTKVTGADGSYCIYKPTVARTDGIDATKDGLEDQTRTCPQ